MSGSDGEESTGFCGRPGTHLGALGRGRAHDSGNVPFDELLPDGFAQHCAQGAVDDLYRPHAKADSSLVGEQGTDLGRGQRPQGYAAQGREDVQTQRRS